MAFGLKSPFAHLGRSAASDDDTKDDKNKSKSKAEDKDDEKDKDKKDDDAKSKKTKAEDGDEDKKKDDDDEDDEKSKSKASDDDDDEDDTSARKARARERGRIRAIMTSAAGMADPVAAAHVALDTTMPRASAIGMLTAMQLGRDAMAASGGSVGAGRSGLRERMEGVPNAEVGADGGQGKGQPTMAERMIAADRRRRGES